MAESNKDKSIHGKNAQEALEDLLLYCRDQKMVVEVIKNYRAGIEGYANRKQFYAPFLVRFLNSIQWIIFSTTSLKTDRVKGQQWDAYNLKRINNKIEKAVLVYPNEISSKEEELFKTQEKKYTSGEEFSAIDAIVSSKRLVEMIEEESLKNESAGFIKDKQGRNFEQYIAMVLSSEKNLRKWKGSSEINVGSDYNTFLTLVEGMSLNKEEVNRIRATSDVPLLQNRGKPKTDILVFVFMDNGETVTKTISCKKSNGKSVTIHEYKADDFAAVLDKDNPSLKELLNDFQSCGNIRDLGPVKEMQLTFELQPYRDKLALWALGGIYGKGNPKIHWAQYILTYDSDNGECKIYRISEYYNMLSSSSSGNFGTCFSWTYPSKKRGKAIQLKAKVL